jgi:hypothetical protein
VKDHEHILVINPDDAYCCWVGSCDFEFDPHDGEELKVPAVFKTSDEAQALLAETREVNPYDAARDRFEAAAAGYAQARIDAVRILRDAEREYEAAEEGLRAFEAKPGIPLPEYQMASQGAG